jgi:hypothetical protein
MSIDGETETLTLDAAMDLPLDGEPEREQDEQITEGADPTAPEEAEALEEVTEAEEEATEEEETDAPETVSATPPPRSWGDDEAKAIWSKLPPEVQRQVATREEQRDQATQRLLSEAGQQRKAAVQATEALGSYAQRAEQAIQAIEQAFQTQGYDKMTKADWARLAQSDPNAYQQHRAYAEYLSEQQQQASQVRANAQLAAQEAFAQTQHEILQQHAPEVVQHQADLVKYLNVTFGYTPDQVRVASAADKLLAYKAMMYDRMSAQAQQRAASSKPVAKPAPKALAASAGQTSTSTARKAGNALKAFQAKPSIENAINLLPDF